MRHRGSQGTLRWCPRSSTQALAVNVAEGHGGHRWGVSLIREGVTEVSLSLSPPQAARRDGDGRGSERGGRPGRAAPALRARGQRRHPGPAPHSPGALRAGDGPHLHPARRAPRGHGMAWGTWDGLGGTRVGGPGRAWGDSGGPGGTQGQDPGQPGGQALLSLCWGHWDVTPQALPGWDLQVLTPQV